ncbi:MAG: TetR/AcrR family transcriptional regulator, partial [Actinomycetia bacterium]|nr:TetR/AcrR family transcriptional regulator [Actinomycetes bacterium]
AYAVLDSFVFGFAFEEAVLPSMDTGDFVEVATDIAGGLDPKVYPTLTAFTSEHVLQPDYSFGASFDFGLDLILEGLRRASQEEAQQ